MRWRWDPTHIGGDVMPQPPPQAPIIQGHSAEQGQHPRARMRSDQALYGDAVPLYRRRPGVNFSSADLRTIQAFPVRPRIEHVIAEEDFGVEGFPRLPGRQPPAGWNGENDATSPFASQGL